MSPWHFHPIFVHFTVGLLVTSSILFLVCAGSGGKSWLSSCLNGARWMFWCGIVAALLTAATGLLAYFTVPGIDDALRGEINKHFAAAVVSAVIYLTLAFFLWRRGPLAPTGGWTLGVAIGILSLLVTGYLGGNLVFNLGVGVNAVSNHSAG